MGILCTIAQPETSSVYFHRHRIVNLIHLCVKAGSAGLDCLNLSRGPRKALESCGQLGAVKELALAGLDSSQGCTGCAAYMAAYDGWEALTRVEGSVLLCLLSVGCEGLGQRVSGGGWVSLRCVVDLGGDGALA